jgi:hypothetical protein
MTEKEIICLVCEKSQELVPLIQLHYLNTTYHICPEHFPMLIHAPQKLAGMLPGAEKLRPHEH